MLDFNKAPPGYEEGIRGYEEGRSRGFSFESESEARAAAWTWYERRLTAWEILVNMDAADAWPRCLTWTDAQLDELERWVAAWQDWMALRTSVEPSLPVPEVLRAT